MDIYEILRERLYFFNGQTGKKPKTIYLGRKQMILIKNYAKENFCFIQRPTEKTGIELFGLEVLEVNVGSHIGIS